MAGENKRKYLAGLMIVGLCLSIVIEGTFLPAAIRADGPNQVGLVVRFSDGDLVTHCVEFDEEQISGLEVLSRAGLEVIYEVGGVYGAAVCKIEKNGCDYPAEDCFCQCPGGPNCAYWSYWHLKDEAWDYSPIGARSYYVSDGGVEGWSWGGELPQVTFEEICAPPSGTTATSIAASAPSSTPTEKPTPAAIQTPSPSASSSRTVLPPTESVTPPSTPESTVLPTSTPLVTPASPPTAAPSPNLISADTPRKPGANIPALVLGVVGVIALLGGLVGMVVMLTTRRGIR